VPFKIKKSGTSEWYDVTDIQPYTITINPAFSGTSGTMPANLLKVADEMYAVNGVNTFEDNVDESAAIVNKLCGVNGSVDMTSQGTVQVSATGTRGGINMNNADAKMGLGACLATDSYFTEGTIDDWYGLGIETPVMWYGEHYDPDLGDDRDYFTFVNKSICGIAIQSLLSKVESADALAEGCVVYGLYIQDINPNNLEWTNMKTYGIYQEGDEPNYLGGSLEVDGAVTINGASRTRVFLDSTLNISSGSWVAVHFTDETFDNLNEFDSTSPDNFQVKMPGTYQVNACVNFLTTYTTDILEMRIVVIRDSTTIPRAYFVTNGFYDPASSSNKQPQSLSLPDLLLLEAEDIVQVQVKVNTAQRLAGENEGFSTYFSIHRSS
jgi:hypothetical protein